jgi:hypothetical protein
METDPLPIHAKELLFDSSSFTKRILPRCGLTNSPPNRREGLPGAKESDGDGDCGRPRSIESEKSSLSDSATESKNSSLTGRKVFLQPPA